MIEADSVNILPLNKIKNIFQLLNIVVINGKAQAHPLTYSHTILNTRHSLLEGAFYPSELVIYILQAIQGNPYITHPNILDALSHLSGNQGAIGGQGWTHPLGLGIFCQFKEIWTNQRLTARE